MTGLGEKLPYPPRKFSPIIFDVPTIQSRHFMRIPTGDFKKYNEYATSKLYNVLLLLPAQMEKKDSTEEKKEHDCLAEIFTKIKESIQAGANPNIIAPQSHTCTALHWAVFHNQAELLKWLLEKRADPNLETPQGTALHFAVEKKDYQAVKYLTEVAKGNLNATRIEEQVVGSNISRFNYKGTGIRTEESDESKITHAVYDKSTRVEFCNVVKTAVKNYKKNKDPLAFDVLEYCLTKRDRIAESDIKHALDACRTFMRTSLFRKEEQNYVDLCLSQLLASNIGDLANKTCGGMKLLVASRNTSAPKLDEMGAEHECALLLRIEVLFRLLLSAEKPELLYNLTNQNFQRLLIQELITELESFQVLTEVKLIDHDFSKEYSDRCYSALAKNIVRKISELKENTEYSLASCWTGHAIYVSFRRGADNYISVCIDNSEIKDYDTETLTSFESMSPEVLGKMDINRLHHYNLENYIKAVLQCLKITPMRDKGKSLIYCNSKELSLQEYDLALMLDEIELEKGKLYVNKTSKNAFVYTVINPLRDKVAGLITKDEFKHDIPEPFTTDKLTPFLADILKITSERGHTSLQIHLLRDLEKDALPIFPKCQRQCIENCWFMSLNMGTYIRMGDNLSLVVATKGEELATRLKARDLDFALVKNRWQPDFEGYLKEYYSHFTNIKLLIDKKEIPIQDCFLNLVLVKEKQEDKQVKDEKIHAHALGKKEIIDIKNIFAHSNPTRQIMILGRAGIGKSTLCQKIVYSWSVDKWFNKDYQCVFWIKFRNLNERNYPKRQEPYTEIDVILKECFSKRELSKWELEALTHMITFNADKILWLLDGLDELPSIIPKSLEAAVNALLQKNHRIVTSRPQQKVQNVDQQAHLEVIGFTNKNIESYVENYFKRSRGAITNPIVRKEVNEPTPELRFSASISSTASDRGSPATTESGQIHRIEIKKSVPSSEEKAQSLITFLKNHITLWGICHIPIILELICTLWTDPNFDRDSQQTMTKLYSAITIWFGRCDLRKELGTKSIKKRFSTARSIENNYRDEFMALEKLAWEGTLRNQISFTDKELKNIDTIFDHESLLRLGILKVNEHNYEFIHLTFQEYFAARHLMTKFIADPNSTDHRNAIQFIISSKYTDRHQLLLNFTAGLFTENATKDQINFFWKTLVSPPLDLTGIAHLTLMARCLEEAHCDERISIQNLLLTDISQWLYATAIKRQKYKNELTFRYNNTRDVDLLILNIDKILKVFESCPTVTSHSTILNKLLSAFQGQEQESMIAIAETLKQLGVSVAIHLVINTLKEAIGNSTKPLTPGTKNIIATTLLELALLTTGDVTEIIMNLPLESGCQSDITHKILTFCRSEKKRCAMPQPPLIHALFKELHPGMEFPRTFMSCTIAALIELAKDIKQRDLICNELYCLLNDTDEQMQLTAITTLEIFSKKVEEYIIPTEIISKLSIKFIETKEEKIRIAIFRILKSLDKSFITPQVQDTLIKSVDSADDTIKLTAIYRLSELGLRSDIAFKAIPFILKYTKKNHYEYAFLILRSLGPLAVRDDVLLCILNELLSSSHELILTLGRIPYGAKSTLLDLYRASPTKVFSFLNYIMRGPQCILQTSEVITSDDKHHDIIDSSRSHQSTKLETYLNVHSVALFALHYITEHVIIDCSNSDELRELINKLITKLLKIIEAGDYLQKQVSNENDHITIMKILSNFGVATKSRQIVDFILRSLLKADCQLDKLLPYNITDLLFKLIPIFTDKDIDILIDPFTNTKLNITLKSSELNEDKFFSQNSSDWINKFCNILGIHLEIIDDSSAGYHNDNKSENPKMPTDGISKTKFLWNSIALRNKIIKNTIRALGIICEGKNSQKVIDKLNQYLIFPNILEDIAIDALIKIANPNSEIIKDIILKLHDQINQQLAKDEAPLNLDKFGKLVTRRGIASFPPIYSLFIKAISIHGKDTDTYIKRIAAENLEKSLTKLEMSDNQNDEKNRIVYALMDVLQRIDINEPPSAFSDLKKIIINIFNKFDLTCFLIKLETSMLNTLIKRKVYLNKTPLRNIIEYYLQNTYQNPKLLASFIVKRTLQDNIPIAVTKHGIVIYDQKNSHPIKSNSKYSVILTEYLIKKFTSATKKEGQPKYLSSSLSIDSHFHRTYQPTKVKQRNSHRSYVNRNLLLSCTTWVISTFLSNTNKNDLEHRCLIIEGKNMFQQYFSWCLHLINDYSHPNSSKICVDRKPYYEGSDYKNILPEGACHIRSEYILREKALTLFPMVKRHRLESKEDKLLQFSYTYTHIEDRFITSPDPHHDLPSVYL